MAGSDTTSSARRAVREGFSRICQTSGFGDLADDDALLRLSAARNAASKSANLFMLTAALAAALYFLRLEGVAGEIKIGDYKLGSVPFGVFVLCGAALTLSSISLVRTGDSRSYDRLLRLACEQRLGGNGQIGFVLYPNEHAWGEPLSKMVHAIRAPFIATLMRGLSLLFLNLFTAALVLLPVISGIDFLYNDRVFLDREFQIQRIGCIFFLTSADILTMYLVFWARMTDRD